MQFRKLWFLQNFSVFQGFPREDLVTAARMIDEHTLNKHDRLYQPGDPADRVYFVKQGRLKIYRRGRFGHKITLAILSPGEVFDELALSAGESHELEIEALETSLVCSIAAKDFQALLDLKPALAFRIIQNLGEQRRMLERKIASLVFKDVPARLAPHLRAEPSGAVVVVMGDVIARRATPFACRHRLACDSVGRLRVPPRPLAGRRGVVSGGAR